jgi:hypothetical protein
MKILVLQVMLAACCSSWSASGFAVEPLLPNQVRAAMQHEREKIRNGAFTAFGSFVIENPETPQLCMRGPVHWSMRFDLATEDFIFDRREPWRGEKDKVLRTYYAMQGDSAYYYTDYLESCAWLRIRKRSSERVEPGDFQYFDPRGLGMSCSPVTIFSLSVDGMKAFFEHSDVKNGAVITVAEESDSILRLSYDTGPEVVNLWVDRARGWTPIKKNYSFKNEVQSETYTAWEQKNGAWVPVSYSDKSKTPFLPKGAEPTVKNLLWRQGEVNLTFNWEYVNDARKSQIVIDYHDMDLPLMTQVFDERGATPKLVHLQGRKLPGYSENSPASSGRSVYGLLAVVFLVILGAFFFWRRRGST